jgi:hypothetical protein
MTRLILLLTSFFFTFVLAHAKNDIPPSYIQLIKSKKKKKSKTQPPPSQQQSKYPPICNDGYDRSYFGVNPFTINFQPKKYVSIEDYIFIQNELKNIDLTSIINKVSESNSSGRSVSRDGLRGRITKQLGNIINIEKNIYPEKKLVKIGSGGDNCVVTYATISGMYPDYVRAILPALERVNFNGYLLYYIGGWPNPTGEEILYCGVPYSFKIFSMVEAYCLGFNKVLWIDSALEPARDLQPLFDYITQHGALIYHYAADPARDEILPRGTRAELFQLTGTDPLQARYVRGGILGLDMETELAKNFVKVNYDYIRRGTPFLSLAPEEFVWSAILGTPPYRKWLDARIFTDDELLYGSDDPNAFIEAQRKGIYFIHRSVRPLLN